jgi:hypothetical protein
MNKILPILVMLGLFVASCSSSDNSTSTGGASAASAPLSTQETETLKYMREEEKLARDVYRTLYNRWGIQLFTNISGSEQQHMDTLAGMLSRYGIPDPVASDSTGSFTNPALASLFNQLVATGEKSAAEAIEVGIAIEQLDIADLRKAIDESTHADLDQAYERLMNGSFNHLSAFTSSSG